MKQIACGDVVPGCAFKAEAPNEEALLLKVADHARQAHGVDEVGPDLLSSVIAAIQEKP